MTDMDPSPEQRRQMIEALNAGVIPSGIHLLSQKFLPTSQPKPKGDPLKTQETRSRQQGSGAFQCGACGDMIAAAALTAHVELRHSRGYALPPLPRKLYARIAPRRPSISTQAMIRCPECHCELRESRLQRHMSKCPGRRAQTRGRAGAPRTTSQGVGARKADVGRSATNDEGQQERLNGRDPIDGSPDGRVFRDHCRFGSHPSHDGYDDESWA
jgi:hypothetical protein